MHRRSSMALALALALAGGAGCSRPARDTPTGGPQKHEAAGRTAGDRSGRSAEQVASAGDSGWQDPEPADAQARAEQMVGSEWNRDKALGLTMRILPLVDRTSGLSGFASGLAARNDSVDQRLARLGAVTRDGEVTIRLSGAILFDFDSASIRADAERTLGEVAEVLRAYGDRPLRVAGHTDSIASDEYNQRLSEQRAAAVRDWLVGHGVAARRIAVAGYGEKQPLADNETAAGRQQNRRVEIVIAKGS